MIEVAPDILNDAPAYISDHTYDVEQRAVDTIGLLDYLSTDVDVAEAEALVFAENAYAVMGGVGVYETELREQWRVESDSINPANNLPGFLEWDGITEPEQMRTLRLSHDRLRTIWKPLNTAIFKFVINTYTRHHITSSDEALRLSQVEDFTSQVIKALKDGEEIPFAADTDGRYHALTAATTQIRTEHFDGILDFLSFQTRLLQQERREFDPEFAETRKAEAVAEAHQARASLDELWSGVFQLDKELEPRWSALQDTLLNIPIQAQPGKSIEPIIGDAIRLLARVEPSLRTISPSSYEKRGYILRGLLLEERQNLSSAKRVLSQVKNVEGLSDQLTSIHNLRPRLFDAALYLYSKSEMIDTLTGGPSIAGSIDGLTLRRFLRRALTGKDNTLDRPDPPAYEKPVSVSEAVAMLAAS